MLQRDVAQLGSALRSGRRGRWFESSHPDWDKSLVQRVSEVSLTLLNKAHSYQSCQWLSNNDASGDGNVLLFRSKSLSQTHSD